jgi:hypothetical protein
MNMLDQLDITYIDVKPFDYAAHEKLVADRPKPLEMYEYGSVISDSDLDALQTSWGFDPEPEPDEMEYASFVVNTCQGLSQNKAAERLAKEFGGKTSAFRSMFQRKQLPITKTGSAWSFTDEYKWKTPEL